MNAHVISVDNELAGTPSRWFSTSSVATRTHWSETRQTAPKSVQDALGGFEIELTEKRSLFAGEVECASCGWRSRITRTRV